MSERFPYRKACETFAQAALKRLGLDGEFVIHNDGGPMRCDYRPAGESYQTHVSPGCGSWAELYAYMRGLSDGAEGLSHLRDHAGLDSRRGGHGVGAPITSGLMRLEA